jgi:hypothetical protein
MEPTNVPKLTQKPGPEDATPGAGIRRIAIVAIHGVGDHHPDEMTRAVARMLASRDCNRYSSFTETNLCARIDPVHLSRPPV